MMNKDIDVLAIGELNVDLIMTGLNSMPIPGREIIGTGFVTTLGSSTAIFASAIAKLGLQTSFLGKIGDDYYGEFAVEALKNNGINVDNVIKDSEISTGITIALNTKTKVDRALVTYLGSIEALKVEDINENLLSRAKHIHVGSFFLQHALRPGLADFFGRARAKGVTVSLDAGWDETGKFDYGIFDVLKNVDIFFPNEVEALHITKCKTIEEAAAQLSRYCKITVIKCGKDGAYLQTGNTIIKSPVYEAEPIDTTGAGDSFNAGFIYGFINGMPLEKCMQYGNACGSASVTRIGGASSCITLEEANRIILDDKV
jgi:sugar/nucleoside kinase (ribokinase family)